MMANIILIIVFVLFIFTSLFTFFAAMGIFSEEVTLIGTIVWAVLGITLVVICVLNNDGSHLHLHYLPIIIFR